MDCKCFLTTARFLSTKGSGEADFRSAVSRAYYACFLAARSIAFKNCREDFRLTGKIRGEKDITHFELQQYLKNGLVVPVRQLGVDLAALHGSRKDADYEMTAQFCKEDAEHSIEEAEWFLAAIASANPHDIGKGMEKRIQTAPPIGGGV